MRAIRWIALALMLPVLAGCGYNRIQTQDEAVKAQWSEVLNQYQRRADLVPNLVNTVKGYAAQEERVLTEVTNARARVGGINITADQASDPAKLAEFQKAQGEMSGALSHLLAVAENYPDLKSNQNFLELQSQLEGTENRITVARNRYIQSVQDYNVLVRQFPVNLTAKVFGYAIKPNFTVENEAAISKPPTVEFAPAVPTPAPATSTPAPAPSN
ncbi:MAG TPA: LemA family protein [Arenimonas sp.]|uniref:LemA family protein n=1 Tax=Arenimonas sp. TaxID=1872635 RepID=UPI002B91362E|nr:LemA family protein [Arenimonas sp.]HMB56095.1 LemA family protein [Arenimonas sp.]